MGSLTLTVVLWLGPIADALAVSGPSLSRSAAGAQYGGDPAHPLPFTGQSIAPLLIGGVLLLVAGLLLRRQATDAR